MNIVLVRVDDRFIHGQILESWIPFLKAQGVIVANDSLAKDHFQKTIMSMAIPERIKLRIVTIDDTLSLNGDTDFKETRTLIIVSSIKDAHRLYSAGLTFPKLNIGNNKGSDTSKQISYSAWVDQEDLDLIKELLEKDMEISLQSVPRERNIDMRSIIDMAKL